MKKDKIVTFRLATEDFLRFEREAKYDQVTLSEWIILACFGRALENYSRRELRIEELENLMKLSSLAKPLLEGDKDRLLSLQGPTSSRH